MNGGREGKGRRVKRTQVQSDDGWTVVSGGSGSGSGSKPSSSVAKAARPTRVVNGLTVEKLVAEYGAMQKRWRKSTCARDLGRMLGLGEWSVEGAVCIGIGSFALDWEHRYRSLWQLVLFMGVVEICEYLPLLYTGACCTCRIKLMTKQCKSRNPHSPSTRKNLPSQTSTNYS